MIAFSLELMQRFARAKPDSELSQRPVDQFQNKQYKAPAPSSERVFMKAESLQRQVSPDVPEYPRTAWRIELSELKRERRLLEALGAPDA